MTEKELSDKLSLTIERKLSGVSDNIQTLIDDLVDYREAIASVESDLSANDPRASYWFHIVHTLQEANEAVVTTEDTIRGDISSEDIKKATAIK